MFLPIRTDSPLRTTPYMNWAIIVANVVVYVMQFVIHSPRGTPPWYDHYVINASEPGSLFTFISSGFLHAGALHLASNMLFLYIFGNNVNDKLGHVGYLAFYVASLVFSSISYVFITRSGTALGASGGVSAVIGAYLVLFPRNHITVFILLWLTTIEVPSVWFVLAFFLQDLLGLSGSSHIGHSAHIGGTVFGFCICVLLLTFNLLPRDRFDIVAMIRQWNRRRLYRHAVNSGWDPYSAGAPVKDETRAGRVAAPVTPEPSIDPRQLLILELRAKISLAISTHDLPAASNFYLELKGLDPQQILSRQQQLDVANQLASEQRYVEAVEAYELFLRHYPKYEQLAQLELMLGVILARYVKKPAQAREYLLRATAKLMDAGAQTMARVELEKIDRELAITTTIPPMSQPLGS